MKCIIKNNLIRRVSDKVAARLVADSDYKYICKQAWKDANKKVYGSSTERVNQIKTKM
ncbi:MAG: hypothetical protein ACXADY_23115 [Candidatus Hodarchaeales archaeon]|jgi:hypothetical protein